jgi:NAD(P)-dependent dehydrogenase (short-subunit alcohol dehydrogenase family)
MQDHEFAGMIALVTGAAGIGIGRAIARRLAAGGAHVVVTDNHPRRTTEVADALSHEFPSTTVIGDVMDVGDRDQIDRVVTKVASELGPISLLVNNAAINWSGPIWDYEVERFDRTLAVNIAGPWYLCRQIMPQMKTVGGGVILNISSSAADEGGRFGTEGVYAMTKGALNALTLTLAADGGPHGIRANTLSTNCVAGTKFMMDHPDQLQRALPLSLLGKLPTPAEVAEAAMFLLSPRSSHITGTILRI